MTAQAGERLIYKGKQYWMASEPLNVYLKKRKKINFVSPSTACWRGYYGKWEIIDKKLFLIELKAYIKDFKVVGLDYLFPGKEKVFAKWFSDKINLPIGKMLQYVHMGYASTFEKNLILYFKKGILFAEKEIDNRNKFKN